MVEDQNMPVPGREEIASQVDKIARSKTFASHIKLCDLLKTLVQAAIEDRTLSEDELGVALFDKPDGWLPLLESAVRERKRLMKNKLKEYYRSEGEADRVLIEFPQRGAIRILYNSMAEASALLNEAQQVMRETLPQVRYEISQRVINLFYGVTALYPSFAPGHAALAEALLIYTASDLPKHLPVKESIVNAEISADKSIELDGSSWLGHIVRATLYCCRFEWDNADKHFQIAFKIEPEKTALSFYYLSYLAAVGKFDELFNRLDRRDYQLPKDHLVFLIDSFFYYLARRKKFAYSSLVRFSTQGHGIENNRAYRDHETILKFDFWPAYFVGILVSFQENALEWAVRYAETGVGESYADSFAGMLILAYGAYGKVNEKFMQIAKSVAKEWTGGRTHVFGETEDPKRLSAFSQALVGMGLGNPELAIAKLHEACEEGYPWAMFFHRLPLFDELREHPEFKRLVVRMNLPALS